MNPKPTTEHIARVFGASVEQIKAQFAKNAQQLRAMANTAREKGGKYRGYTASRWDELAAQAEAKAR